MIARRSPPAGEKRSTPLLSPRPRHRHRARFVRGTAWQDLPYALFYPLIGIGAASGPRCRSWRYNARFPDAGGRFGVLRVLDEPPVRVRITKPRGGLSTSPTADPSIWVWVRLPPSHMARAGAAAPTIVIAATNNTARLLFGGGSLVVRCRTVD